MKKHGKRYSESAQKVDKNKKYSIEDAAKKLKDVGTAKFNETVDIAIRLGVDPRHADQMIRGSVVLPKGTGKKVRVLVITKGEKIKEASDAGADFVGSEDMIDKISKGWLDFDKIVATPDIMGAVGKLGKLLGPRGLMPNPKSGTVTFDVAKAIQEIRAGKVEFRVDKGGVIHAPMGKAGFKYEDLVDNIETFLETLSRLKPAASKGRYMKGIVLSTTMGPPVKLDEIQVSKMLRVT